MTITAIVDRFDKGNAILLADELGLQIDLPAELVMGVYKKGEVIELTLFKGANEMQWKIKGD